MTTPERLRRRQRIEGAVLVLLAIFTVLQSIYFNIEDRDQRECFERKFTASSMVSGLRADLASRETAATQNVLSVYADAVGARGGDVGKPLPPARLRELQVRMFEALMEFEQETDQIQRERRDNPIPPYPVGTCDKDGQ